MPSYPVFASYAQADRQRELERFAKELREEVRSKLGKTDPMSVIFFDREGVKAGDKLNGKVIDAARTADVLVCIMSPTYLWREWCGRELEIFLRRQAKMAAGINARFIIPIWWEKPAKKRPLPKKLAQFLHTDALFPSKYNDFGVKYLARFARPQFLKMTTGLAERIADTLANTPHRLPEGEEVQDIEQIPNAFDEQQPYDVVLLALTPGGTAWRPSSADGTIAEAAQQAAMSRQVFVRPAETGPGMVAGLQKAEAEKQVLLAVVDASSAPDATVQQVNQLGLTNLALLLFVDAEPVVDADGWMAQMPQGSFAQARATGLMYVAGPGGLTAEMDRLIDAAQRRLQAREPGAKVEDAALKEKAKEQGIAVDVTPSLAGPGSETKP